MSKPYYEDSAVQIYHGDCREFDFNTDAVITDPPWNMGYFKDDSKSWKEYSEWLDSVLIKFCASAGGQVWFLSSKSIPHVAHLFSEWTAFASVKNFSQMNGHTLPNCWDIAFIRSTQFLGRGRNWFHCNTAGMLSDRTDHPTPRTYDVMSYIIGMHGWMTILDPFMGSGTTLRAAKDLGRKAIGIEIEERYCEIAARRMAQEVFQFA